MSSFRDRWTEPDLERALDDLPVAVLTGPRQVGKSTLLRNAAFLRGVDVLDLDDLELRGRLEADPGLAWAGRDRVVVDEVQRVPDLLPSLKAHVDQHRDTFQAVLSGSANLLLMRDVAESLAGRAAYLELLPFALGEWHGKRPPDLLDLLLAGELPAEGPAADADADAAIHRGLLPPPLEARQPTAWWDAYVRTYLERDLRDLSEVASLPDFRRVMAWLALGSGQVLNESEIARRVAVSQPTVHRHLNLLEVSHLVHRIPAWAENRGKRVTKRPKLHWADPGLAAFLAGLFAPEDVRDSREAGALFETMVVHHLRVLASLRTPHAHLHHWRTSDGKEVDVVLSWGRQLLAFECKRTRRPSVADAAHLRLFRELHPECAAAVLVHGGDRICHLGGRVLALPWTVLAGL